MLERDVSMAKRPQEQLRAERRRVTDDPVAWRTCEYGPERTLVTELPRPLDQAIGKEAVSDVGQHLWVVPLFLGEFHCGKVAYEGKEYLHLDAILGCPEPPS